MVTYEELYDLNASTPLKNRIAIAVTVKAQTLFDLATPTAAQVNWAKAAIANPHVIAEDFLKYLLAKNKSLTVAQINAVTDTGIQTAVDALVDKIISGGT